MNPPTAPSDHTVNPPSPIPAVLVAGLDADQRARDLQTLLDTRPPHHIWAVITADLSALAALSATPGVKAAFVAPGCLCCTGLLPFRVGLVRLLRSMAAAPPAKILVDAGPSRHAEQMRATLGGSQFASLIRLQEGTGPAGPAPSCG